MQQKFHPIVPKYFQPDIPKGQELYEQPHTIDFQLSLLRGAAVITPSYLIFKQPTRSDLKPSKIKAKINVLVHTAGQTVSHLQLGLLVNLFGEVVMVKPANFNEFEIDCHTNTSIPYFDTNNISQYFSMNINDIGKNILLLAENDIINIFVQLQIFQ